MRDGEQSTQHTRERRVDSQLIFATNAHRLHRPHHILASILEMDGGRAPEMADFFRLNGRTEGIITVQRHRVGPDADGTVGTVPLH